MVNDPGDPFDGGIGDEFGGGFDEPDLGDWVSDLFDEHGAPDPPGGGDLDADLDQHPDLDLDRELHAPGVDLEPDADRDVDDAAAPSDADPGDHAGAGEHRSDRIELPVDDLPGDELPSDDPAYDDGPDLDPTGVPWPDEHAGVVALSTLDHVLGVTGHGLDPLIDAAERLGIGDELDLGFDGRTTSVLLEELGVDAITVHGDLDDLAGRVDRGDEVLVGGVDGSTLRIVDVDRGRLVAQGLDGGAPVAIAVEEFEDAWADAAYEMVVVDPPAVADPAAISLTAPITLVQVTLDPGSMR